MVETAYLVLQNGQVIPALAFGKKGEIAGELVFTSSMVGYLETLSDPGYAGQLVVQTFPMMGNYGVIPEDFQCEAPALRAYIVHEVCQAPSNFRSVGNLADYLEKAGVVGLSGVDTRALTRMLRETGVMNAAIVSELPPDLPAFCAALSRQENFSRVEEVSVKEAFCLNPEGAKHVVLWDLGYQRSMADALIDRGCKVSVVPAGTSAKALLALRPNGVFLSNGPGDPAMNTGIIRELREVMGNQLPTMGVGLGHQLLALAMGGRSVKLKYGHRGSNQPVRRMEDGRLFTTTQNQGYAIDRSQLPPGAALTYENVNDATCEGLAYSSNPAFSVQFCPDAFGGAHSTSYLYDEFVAMLGENTCR